MKKTLKILAIVAFMLVTLVALTGCGGDKLVATKTTEEKGLTGETVKYEEKMEISFKDDKVNNVKMTFTFEKEEDAKSYVEAFNGLMAMANAFSEEEIKLPTLEQKGKSAVMELDAAEYAEMSNEEEAGMTKAEIKASLEEDGYTVK